MIADARILVVSHSTRMLRERAAALGEGVAPRQVIACPAIDLVASMLEFNETSVVVADFSPRTAVLLPRLSRSWPQTRFVLLAGTEDVEAARTVVEESDALLLLLPARLALLVEVVRRQADAYRSESGVTCFSVEEMLQLSAVSSRTTLLRVWSAGKFGHLVVERGVLVDAEREGQTGREAAFEVLGWEDASVVSLALRSTPRATFDLPLGSVMMEAARRRDECQGRGGRISLALARLVRSPRALAAMVIDLDNGRTLNAKVGSAAVPSGLRDMACAAERAVRSLVCNGHDPDLTAVEMLTMTLVDFELLLAPVSGALAILAIASADAPIAELRTATLAAARELRSVVTPAPAAPFHLSADPFAK
jgi:hypothetical protein